MIDYVFDIDTARACLILFLGSIMLGVPKFLGLLNAIKCQISDDMLRICRGRSCLHQFPLKDLDLRNIFLTDLTFDPGKRPRRRLNKTGFFKRGIDWYELRNGDRALVFITNPRSVLYIPTRLGFTILMSVDNSTQLLNQLRRAQSGDAE